MAGGGGEHDGPSSHEGPQDRERRLELEARVFGGGEPDPEDVAELRGLLQAWSARHTPERSDDAAPGSGMQAADAPQGAVPVADVRTRPRPPVAWLAAAATAVLLAGGIGAGVTAGILRPSSSTSAGDDYATVTRSVEQAGTDTNVGATGLAGRELASRAAAVARAESLGAQYFSRPQTKADVPTLVLPRIDAATTRRVLVQWGDVAGEAKVWVARGVDDSYCLVMSTDPTHGASACTPAADAASTGVRLGISDGDGGTIEARWNLSAGLLQLSPFPSA